MIGESDQCSDVLFKLLVAGVSRENLDHMRIRGSYSAQRQSEVNRPVAVQMVSDLPHRTGGLVAKPPHRFRHPLLKGPGRLTEQFKRPLHGGIARIDHVLDPARCQRSAHPDLCEYVARAAEARSTRGSTRRAGFPRRATLNASTQSSSLINLSPTYRTARPGTAPLRAMTGSATSPFRRTRRLAAPADDSWMDVQPAVQDPPELPGVARMAWPPHVGWADDDPGRGRIVQRGGRVTSSARTLLWPYAVNGENSSSVRGDVRRMDVLGRGGDIPVRSTSAPRDI